MKLSLRCAFLGLFQCLVLMLTLCCQQAVAANPLRIVTENMPPYNYQDDSGKVSGPSAEVVHELLKSMNLTVKMEVYPWARAYREATNAPNVLIFSIVRTPQREDDFHWLSGIGPIDIQLFGSADDDITDCQAGNSARFDDLNRAANRTIGLLRQSSQLNFIKSHQDIQATDLVVGKSYEDLYKMHQRGRIDFFLAPGFLVHYLNNKLNTPSQHLPTSYYTIPSKHQRKLYLAFSKNTPMQTVNKFKTALEKLHQSGKVAQIFDKFHAQLVAKNTL